MLFSGLASAQRFEQTDSLQELTLEQADSLFFRFSHHYTINYNFIVRADSLALVSHETDIIDTSYVYKDDRIAVANISQTDSDTIWIKIFRDQMTMGWTTENALLDSTMPDDTISQAINYFMHHISMMIFILVCLALIGILFWKINRVYSVFLIILEIATVAVFVFLQHDAPEYLWEYYFNPSVNPFILPREMMILLLLVWMILIVLMAYVFILFDYISHKYHFNETSESLNGAEN